MDNKTIALLIVGLVGCLLTAIRRVYNTETDAGSGVAAWTIVLILIILLS